VLVQLLDNHKPGRTIHIGKQEFANGRRNINYESRRNINSQIIQHTAPQCLGSNWQTQNPSHQKTCRRRTVYGIDKRNGRTLFGYQ
jgi:hypothetical protein